MIHHVVVFSANETGLSAQRSLVLTTVRRIKGLWRYERCNDRLVALELLERRKIIGLTNRYEEVTGKLPIQQRLNACVIGNQIFSDIPLKHNTQAA